ncbi:MAG TPA: hypothetical protein VMJ73_06370 [Rhizomicrobium sp.]|nr:hypothetical protein [Rhizomicrobium sp.]
MTSPGKPGDGDIYVEFVVQGGFVKVTAIDSKSGTEASVMGPAGAARGALADAAVRKLAYMLNRDRDKG